MDPRIRRLDEPYLSIRGVLGVAVEWGARPSVRVGRDARSVNIPLVAAALENKIASALRQERDAIANAAYPPVPDA